MLTLIKTPRLTLKKSVINTQHVTLSQVFSNLAKQTRHIDSMVSGFINAGVELAHDCSMDADWSLVDDRARKMVHDFVTKFYHANHHAIMAHYNTGLYFHWGWTGLGSDLFCTVAGHGCGFWEHQTGKPLADWLEDYGCEFCAYNAEDEHGTLEEYECNLWKYGKA